MVEDVTQVIDIPAEEAPRRIRAIGAALRVLVLPRSTFGRVATDAVTVWPTALALVSFAAAVKTGVALGLAMRGSGFPAVVAIRYGWEILGPVAFALVFAGALVVVQRWWDGQRSFGSLLCATSLALVPLALRYLVQAAYMGATQRVLMHPGLSALLAPPPATLGGRIAYALLGQLDLFALWAFVLLVVAVSGMSDRGWVKPFVTVTGLALVVSVVGAAPSLVVAALLGR